VHLQKSQQVFGTVAGDEFVKLGCADS